MLTHEHQRGRGDADQVLRDAADQHALEAASAVRTDHDQICAPLARAVGDQLGDASVRRGLDQQALGLTPGSRRLGRGLSSKRLPASRISPLTFSMSM